MFPPIQEQMERIAAGTEEILPREQLLEKLERSRDEGQPLRIKMGFDPSAPDIHLGHAVGLRKLKTFQDLGHHIVLIVGDYTGMVGDPTGRSETRPRLTHEEVRVNANTYLEQFYKVLSRERSEVRWNGEWFSKMNFQEVMGLAARFTVARMLERDDFEKRYKGGRPISIHEFFYPIMQGYDSVAVRADVELGGTDQKFNLLMGRTLQEAHGQDPQIIVTTPILEGIDGVQRMSKSIGNYIGVDESPREMFGKVMSIPDAMILRYYLLAAEATPSELDEVRKDLAAGRNPRELKAALGRRIVGLYHGAEAGNAASEEFDRMFRKGEAPEEMPVLHLEAAEPGLWIIRAASEAGLVKSNSEARRMVKQRAVRVDGVRVDDEALVLPVREAPYEIQVGKRAWARVHVDRPSKDRNTS